MTNPEESELPATSGVMLRDAYPQILEKLAEHIDELGQDIVQQLNDILVASQVLNGTPENFSFMAYPVPRLTFEQRQLMDMQGTTSINVDLQESHIRIDLDDFGKINWFYITNLPEMYAALQKYMPM